MRITVSKEDTTVFKRIPEDMLLFLNTTLKLDPFKDMTVITRGTGYMIRPKADITFTKDMVIEMGKLKSFKSFNTGKLGFYISGTGLLKG